MKLSDYPVGLIPEGLASARGDNCTDDLRHRLHEAFARGPILVNESHRLVAEAHRLILHAYALQARRAHVRPKYPRLGDIEQT